jgi:Protein of unknown function (DUF3105)
VAKARRKPPKKKRRSAAPGVDADQRRRERLEARRRQKAEALARVQRAERIRRVVRMGALVVLGLGAYWFFFIRPEGRPERIGGHELQLVAENLGVNEHTDDPVSYSTTPPVAGPHTQSAAPCGVLGEQIQDGPLVHSLEHGTVGLLYDPTAAAPADIRRLEDIVRDFDSYVLSAPYSGMDSPITVVSWGELMPLDSLDEPAIRQYVAQFRGTGPENPAPPCPTSADQPFEPAAGPTPSPAPSPEPSPSPNRSPQGKKEKKGTGGD